MTDPEKRQVYQQVMQALSFEAPGGELDPRTSELVVKFVDDPAWLEEHPLPEPPRGAKMIAWIEATVLAILAQLGSTVEESQKDPVPTAGRVDDSSGPAERPPLPYPY